MPEWIQWVTVAGVAWFTIGVVAVIVRQARDR